MTDIARSRLLAVRSATAVGSHLAGLLRGIAFLGSVAAIGTALTLGAGIGKPVQTMTIAAYGAR